MKKLLVVVDMQNDFVTGSLATKESRGIVPYVCNKVDAYKKQNDIIIFTRDTHGDNYLDTHEGRHLPIVHCKEGTTGHAIISELDSSDCVITDKCSFTSIDFAKTVVDIVEANDITQIELCGLCTDICIVSNALVIKAALPEMDIVVDARACAGITPEKHNAALDVLASCHVSIVGR